MKQEQMTEDERKEVAMNVAEELKKGKITKEAIEGFKKLMGRERLEELSTPVPSHFGIVPLPDDDW